MRTDYTGDAFMQNNMGFRTISSSMLHRLKESQSFLLSQLEYSKYSFSRTSKELGILYSYRLFSWAEEFETHVIKNGLLSHPERLDRKQIIKSLDAMMNHAYNISMSEDVFVKKDISMLVGMWKSNVLQGVREYIRGESLSHSTVVVYTKIVSILIEALTFLRLSIYEADNLVEKKSTPFICLNDGIVLSIFSNLSHINKKEVEYAKYTNNKDIKFLNYCSDDRRFNTIMKIIKGVRSEQPK